jgi:acetyl esterase/lipase
LLYRDSLLNDVAKEKKQYNLKGELTHIYGEVVPRLLVYRPEEPCGTGVVVLPGGGYWRHNVENTRFVAERLNKYGITVFVLIYHLPINDSSKTNYFDGIKDVQLAFEKIRSNAKSWGLSKDKIGLWGSSAGGHLAATAATHCQTSFWPEKKIFDYCPDFLVLTFPVISFRPNLAHEGSVKALLGDTAKEELIAFFSADESVNNSTPPTFLVHGDADFTVSSENSISFYLALKRNKIPAELHIYEKGVHGFGLRPEINNSWFNELIVWLEGRDLIGG